MDRPTLTPAGRLHELIVFDWIMRESTGIAHTIAASFVPN